MTVTVATGVAIAAAPDVVWAAIERIDTHTGWMRDAERITYCSERHEGVGAEFECRTRVGPLRTDDRFVVTRWEPGVCMGIEHRGAVTGAGEFRLRPLAGGAGTWFVWDEQLRFPGRLGGAVGERLARPVLRRVWAGNLRRLRALVEAREDRRVSGR